MPGMPEITSGTLLSSSCFWCHDPFNWRNVLISILWHSWNISSVHGYVSFTVKFIKDVYRETTKVFLRYRIPKIWVQFKNFERVQKKFKPEKKLNYNRSNHQITALFTNMWILKFKSHLAIAFFTAINHLNWPLRKQNFTLTSSKGHGFWFVIGGFQSILCVSVFQGYYFACDCNYDWQQWKTQLWRQLLNLRVRMFVKSAVKTLGFYIWIQISH